MRRFIRRLWRKRLTPWAAYWLNEYREWRFMCRYRRQEKERARMEADQTKLALARSMLAGLDAQYVTALKQVAAEELRESVYAEALAEARASLTEEFERRRERLLDELDRQRRDLEQDLEARLDQEIAKGVRDQAQDWQDQLSEAKAARREARDRAAQAEGVLVQLLKQVLPEGKRVYLYSLGVRELPLAELNTVLARVGLVVKGRQTYSERMVACVTAPGRVEGKTLFFLTKVTPEGVVDEDEAGDEQRAENQPVIPDRLALPASGEGG